MIPPAAARLKATTMTMAIVRRRIRTDCLGAFGSDAEAVADEGGGAEAAGGGCDMGRQSFQKGKQEGTSSMAPDARHVPEAVLSRPHLQAPVQGFDAFAHPLMPKPPPRWPCTPASVPVNTHVSRILSKLGLCDRTQIVVAADDSGLVVAGS
ncbi:hypothetical protein GCM10009690_12140 [Brevibacterium permense]|uniref:Uncharacterized protein n=1 Tax=Brevibacterium permense TaxID=234834 RepID=A0ABN2A494_9MICO